MKYALSAIAALLVGACTPIPTHPVADSVRYLQITENGTTVIAQLDMQNAEWCKYMQERIDFAPPRAGRCSVFSRAKSLDWSVSATAGMGGPVIDIRTRTYEECQVTYQKMEASFAQEEPRQWFWREVCMERPA